MRQLIAPNRRPITEALIDKKNVMSAVMLRDMRTRFFNHGLGFIVVPLWPLAHMGIIIMIHSYVHQVPAYGDNSAVFFMTGVLPFLAFSYVSRFMAFSLVTNQSMLAFPAVKISDILMGRAVLEIIASFITLIFMMTIFYISGIDPYPADLQSATLCYISMLYLAFGTGYFIGICSIITPLLLTFFQLFIILLYVSSGVFFSASNLPESITEYIAYNPITVCIEWFRSAYFESYSDKLVSAPYVVGFATILLLLGLTIEQTFARSLSDK
ncbi:ABC transporter permease [Rhizobium sp. CNPSo 4062]|uniref:ABC transporter permease n=1 Tax=Rhizobium sp. CNPSo 4062 TaxID=3021410 RepID=UPI0013B039CC|nr:ABC transporter permease [Rhizobium sp. CNPSo 4062]MDK4705012.1 ABC transporter permease [Rhizobium sp. CNPSo 4062]